MITWIAAQIPLWVYVTVGLISAAAVFYFMSPILVPLWAITPKWVKWTLGGVGALLATYVFGLNKGSRAEKEMQRQREARGNEHREENDRQVRNRPDDKLDRDFDKWVR